MFERLDIPDHLIQNKKFSISEYINHRAGAIGGIIMGVPVFYVNYEHGIDLATLSSSKQFFYTFLVGGTMTKLSENIAIRYENSNFSKIASSLVPSTLTSTLTYCVHSLSQTPEPFESTVPTMVMTPIVFGIFGYKKRSNLEKKLLEEK